MSLILLSGFLLAVPVFAADALAANPDQMLRNIEGRYTGTMLLYTRARGVSEKKYDYAVTIMDVVPERKTLSLKVECEECSKKEYVTKNCLLTAEQPEIRFSCKGESWHIDYQLQDEALKGNGINTNSLAYSVSVKKVHQQQ